MKPIEGKLFVGVDWGSQEHEVCAVDSSGNVVTRWSVAHTGEQIVMFVDALLRIVDGQAERVLAAMETPHGAILEHLMERGVAVYAINPKQLDRFRDRHSVSGAKDDPRDAFVIADALRTDTAKFSYIKPAEPLLVQLRELSRAHDELQTDFQAQANRLREAVHRFFPQMLELAGPEEPLLWGLLRLIPTPADAKNARPAKIKAVLREHRIRRIDVDEVLKKLRTTPLPVAPGVTEAVSEHITMLIPRLQVIHEQRQRCHKRLEALIEILSSVPPPSSPDEAPKNSDVKIVDSIKGAGTLFVAAMFGEAYGLVATRDLERLRHQTGIAPVTKKSGKSRTVSMRMACNTRLRNAMFHMAKVNVMYDDNSRRLYDNARARGQSQGNALRTVGDRLLRVLVSMLRNNKLYVLSDGEHSADAITEAA